MTDHYHLYLDESTAPPMFCVAGFIISSSKVNDAEQEVNRIKSSVWSDIPNPTSIVLHEKDITQVNRDGYAKTAKISSEYSRFEHNAVAKSLYIEIEKSFNNLDVKIIGSCINTGELELYYSERNMNDCYFTAMQNIIENFVQYLIKNNATGEIFLESRDSVTDNSLRSADRQVRQHYSSILSIGSMFISRHAIQDHLKGITFVPKTANNACVQLADFLPNQFARKETHRKPKIYGMNRVLKELLYDGTVNNKKRFGVKVIPSSIPAPVATPKVRSPRRQKSKSRGKRSRGKRTNSN